MVAGFRRSHSLSGAANPCASPFHRPYSIKPNHVRSTSVPCCSHPTLAHLEDEIQSLRSLLASFESESSAASWFSDGLDRIDRVHAALADFLDLPQAQETPLPGRPTVGVSADRLLNDALSLADAYGSLRSVTDALKHHIAEARAAIRRGDSTRLSSAVRSQRCAEKELARVAAAIKDLTKSSQLFNLELMEDAAEVEFVGIIREVVAVTATASVAIITAIAALTSSATVAAASTAKDSSALWSLKRLPLPRSSRKSELSAAAAEIVAFEKLEGLEESLERLEKGSESVFRSLVNTRVSLLNILTPSL